MSTNSTSDIQPYIRDCVIPGILRQMKRHKRTFGDQLKFMISDEDGWVSDLTSLITSENIPLGRTKEMISEGIGISVTRKKFETGEKSHDQLTVTSLTDTAATFSHFDLILRIWMTTIAGHQDG